MRKILLAAAIVALVAAGCGIDDEAGDSAGPSTSTSTSAGPRPGTGGTVPVQLEGKVNDHGTTELGADERELEMEADDFYFARPSSRPRRARRLRSR